MRFQETRPEPVSRAAEQQLGIVGVCMCVYMCVGGRVTGKENPALSKYEAGILHSYFPPWSALP